VSGSTDTPSPALRDRLTGHEYDIRAQYVIGADGGRSAVAAGVGLPFEGQMDLAGSMSIVFHADLSQYVAHRPSVLYWVLQPGADVGGIGMGVIRMVRPWNEWLVIWGYDIAQPPPEVDDEMAIKIVHDLVGDDSIPVTIRSTSLWGNNKMYATRYWAGRVFCMGDAVHRVLCLRLTDGDRQPEVQRGLTGLTRTSCRPPPAPPPAGSPRRGCSRCGCRSQRSPAR